MSEQNVAQERAQMYREMEEKRARKAEEKLARQMDTFMLVIGAAYPLVGMVWGVVLSLHKGLSMRVRGAWMFLSATVGIVLWWMIWKAWGDKIIEALMPTKFLPPW